MFSLNRTLGFGLGLLLVAAVAAAAFVHGVPHVDLHQFALLSALPLAGTMDVQVKDALDKLGSTFEQFKSANEERLKSLEQFKSDPLADDKLKKINAELDKLEAVTKAVDALQAKINRAKIFSKGGEEDPDKLAHKQAFSAFMRKGNTDGLRELEVKALNITTSADGGYAVPTELDLNIDAAVVNISPIRSIANVIRISTSDYKRLFNKRGTASGWVDEDDARAATNTPQLAQFIPSLGEIYSNPQATQQMLDDVGFDAEAWLAGEVATEFAYQEGVAFVGGNGTKKPKGILTYATSFLEDATRPYGEVQLVATGVAANFPAISASLGTGPADTLITAMGKLKKPYRANARWLLNKSTLHTMRGWKDVNGRYIWTLSMAEGIPSNILGYPYEESEDMPDIGAGAKCVAFGDFMRGYTIVDRMGTRVLRDPFTNKPYVGFYTTKRVGGGVYNTEAIKVIQCTATGATTT